jgi:zinc protease
VTAESAHRERTPARLAGIAALALALVFAVCAQTAAAQATQTPPAAKPAEAAAPAVPPDVQLVAQMPAGAPAKEYRFPVIAKRTLANGIQVYVVHSAAMPAVGVQLLLTDAGAVNDPPGKPGVASMVASLLTQSTDKRDAQQIAQSIDFVGGALSASTGDDGTMVTVTVVKKDFDIGMDLLADIVLHANFPPEELDRQRQQLLSSLRVNYDDADYLATAAIQRLVYGNSPYAMPNEGTPASVSSIQRDDLVKFRDAYYSPDTALLAFSGDITPEAAFAAAEKYFGGWARKTVTLPSHPAPASAAGIHITVIDKPDAVQTQIRVGKLGIKRSDPDFIPLYVANRVFGGGYNSRLNTAVRLRAGLTYGADSEFDTRQEGGSFLASTFTRTETTVDALRLVMDQIKDMSAGNVKQDELNFARDYLTGVYPIQTETPDEVASRVITVVHYGLPADYNETYQSRIAAVNLAQVNAVSQKYFQPGSLDIVLVGNAAQFRDALKKEFPDATYDEFPAAQLDLLAPELRRKADVLPAPTPQSLTDGINIVTAAAKAAGGDALAKIQSVEYTATGTVATPNGSLPIEQKVYLLYPDRYRQETQINTPATGGASLVLAFDGKTAWGSSAQGSSALPPEQNAEFIRRILVFGGWGLYRGVQGGTIQAQGLGQKTFVGQQADAVAVTAGSIKFIAYFDPVTHLPAGLGYSQATPGGVVNTTEAWTDYKEVEGEKFPVTIVTFRDNQKFSENKVEEIKVNTNPNPSLFVKPQ